MNKKLVKLISLSIPMLAISACSTIKDVTNVDLNKVDLWPFGKNSDQPREYQPANSIPYGCEANKKFFIRYLDKGESVWLILPDREVALPQIGTSKVFSNGITKLDLSGNDATLEINETTKYLGCKANPVAKVAKVEPKGIDKPVEKAPEPLAAKKEEPLAQVAQAKPVEPIKAQAVVEPEAKVAKEEVAEKAVAEEKAAPQNTDQVAVAKALDAWANAWRSKNMSAYLASYAPKFKPEGMSKKAWEAQRKQRVGANPGEITLILDKVDIVADGKKATVTFAQHYATAKYSDDVVKVLSFENVKDQWLIVKETAKTVSAKK